MEWIQAYGLMLLTILVRQDFSIFDMLFESRIDHELLAYRVPGQFPGEHVLILGLLILVRRFGNAVVVALNLSVVLLDSTDNARGAHYGGLGGVAFGG